MAALVAILLLAALSGVAAVAATIEPDRAAVLLAPGDTPPAPDDPAWAEAALPDWRQAPGAWYRLRFDKAAGDSSLWALYMPYVYGEARVWVNGELLGPLLDGPAGEQVSGERPMLVPLPPRFLRPGGNELLLQMAPERASGVTVLPRLVIGPQRELWPYFDRRLWSARIVPLATLATGAAVGLLVLFVWARRPGEALYGWFGLAVLLWGLRTAMLVFDSMPVGWWPTFRLLYFAGTGGFVIVMALFALCLAGWSRPAITRALGAYGLLGPCLYLLAGAGVRDRWVGLYWLGGLIPIGLGLVVVSVAAAWRQRTVQTMALLLSVTLAVLAGVHDFAVTWRPDWLPAWALAWAGQRVFLLHHAANLLLFVMGVVLAVRFVDSLRAVEQMNRGLEQRVASREQEIAESYARIATLQREQAAADERQRIMRELHDGLGSRLFTALSRVERGVMDRAGMGDALREAIADMRLAIEALASEDQDFRTALGDFMFRWDVQLRDAGLAATWSIDAADEALALPPHAALQILRVLQEALTNVVKHARASKVAVTLTPLPDGLMLRVDDDGCGIGAAGLAEPGHGRGLANMRARAARLGASLDVVGLDRGTRLQLRWPRAA